MILGFEIKELWKEVIESKYNNGRNIKKRSSMKESN